VAVGALGSGLKVKLTEHADVPVPVVYAVALHDPAAHVPPTVEFVVNPVFGVTVNDALEPLVTP
jgi:hypothetical protein